MTAEVNSELVQHFLGRPAAVRHGESRAVGRRVVGEHVYVVDHRHRAAGGQVPCRGAATRPGLGRLPLRGAERNHRNHDCASAGRAAARLSTSAAPAASSGGDEGCHELRTCRSGRRHSAGSKYRRGRVVADLSVIPELPQQVRYPVDTPVSRHTDRTVAVAGRSETLGRMDRDRGDARIEIAISAVPLKGRRR